MSDYLDINNEELLKDFFTEAEQQVENLESNILVIENDPSNHEAIDEIFRAAHTLKGGSATVEMTELSGFTHTVEDVLDELRSDRLQVTEPVVDVLLDSIDTIKAMLESRANGSVYQDDVNPLLERLRAFIPEKQDKKSKKTAPVQPAVQVAKPEPAQPVAEQPAETGSAVLSDSEYAELSQVCEQDQKLWCVTVQFDESNPMNSVGGIQVFAALKACGSVLKTVPDFDALYEDEFYPTVRYYIASASSASDLEDVAFLNDVTLSTDAQLVEPESSSKKSTVTPEPAQTQPAVSPVAETPAAVQNEPVQSVQVSAEKTQEPVAQSPVEQEQKLQEKLPLLQELIFNRALYCVLIQNALTIFLISFQKLSSQRLHSTRLRHR